MTSTPPAWAHLEPRSVKALLEPSGEMPKALRLTPHEVSVETALAVLMVAAARLLLDLGANQNGLVLTPAGYLKRAMSGTSSIERNGRASTRPRRWL